MTEYIYVYTSVRLELKTTRSSVDKVISSRNLDIVSELFRNHVLEYLQNNGYSTDENNKKLTDEDASKISIKELKNILYYLDNEYCCGGIEEDGSGSFITGDSGYGHIYEITKTKLE